MNAPFLPDFGNQSYKKPVEPGTEFERIKVIPVREWNAERAALRDEMRYICQKPRSVQTLWDAQADVLVDTMDAEGLFGAISVGKGKTLIAQLIPTVLDIPDAVIMMTPGLVRQAETMMDTYKASFNIRDDFTFLPFTTLSSPNNHDALEVLRPKLIIVDECQKLADPKTAIVKRFMHYARENPDVIFCFMSGSITRNSILQFAPFMNLALKDWSPLPRDYKTLNEWASAVDVSDDPRPPGVLLQFCTEEEQEKVRMGKMEPEYAARRGLQRRMFSVRGCIASPENIIYLRNSDRQSDLTIQFVDYQIPERSQQALERLAVLWERPDGEQLSHAIEVTRVEHQLKLGGYYRWKWKQGQPDRDWLEARALFRSELRTFLKHDSSPGLDSPFLVCKTINDLFTWDSGELIGKPLTIEQAMAVMQAKEEKNPDTVIDSYHEKTKKAVSAERQLAKLKIAHRKFMLSSLPQFYFMYQEHDNRLKEEKLLPETEWCWIDEPDKTWLANLRAACGGNLDPCIYWTDVVAVGERVARLARISYYGAGARAAKYLLYEDGSLSIGCSTQAHGIGRNLQMFQRAILLGGSPTGTTWEQLLARLHRNGQQQDVTYYILSCFKQELKRALQDARYIQATTGNKQKLLTAKIIGAGYDGIQEEW